MTGSWWSNCWWDEGTIRLLLKALVWERQMDMMNWIHKRILWILRWHCLNVINWPLLCIPSWTRKSLLVIDDWLITFVPLLRLKILPSIILGWWVLSRLWTKTTNKTSFHGSPIATRLITNRSTRRVVPLWRNGCRRAMELLNSLLETGY
jgi:hypothetical protein